MRRWFPWFVAVAWTMLWTPTVGAATVKVYVAEPGVYAVTFEELAAVPGWSNESVPSSGLRLSHLGRPLPLWVEDGGDGRFGPGDRSLFLASTDLFQPLQRELYSSLVVLLLEVGSSGLASESFEVPKVSEPSELPRAHVRRRLRFEEDQLRAPLTSVERVAGMDSLWFWTTLSQRSSSALSVDLGDFADRAEGDALDLELRIRLLGWSQPETPEGMPQHQVEVSLNGQKVGEGSWDGRVLHEIRLTDLPVDLLEESGNRLTLRIPQRISTEGGEPLIDISYVDWVEVEYGATQSLIGGGPLMLEPAATARWLPDENRSSDSHVFSTAGWRVPAALSLGWVLPATDSEAELWIEEESGLGKVVGLETTTSGARSLEKDYDYLLLAPPELIPGAERLAEVHRRRGLRVAVVNVLAIYDEFGHGQQSPLAIQRFLDHQVDSSDSLRYVLLVGDADWLRAGDVTPYGGADPERRNRIPTWTFLSRYGPAASDHFFAQDPENEAAPRFAIGRLPVVDSDELNEVIQKIITWLDRPEPTGTPSALLFSDQTSPSASRARRLKRRLVDVELELRGIGEEAEQALDTRLIEALHGEPDFVHFEGHGSRHMWQLGESKTFLPEQYFDLEDVERLQSARRFPVVLSVSCATAPFDHPSATSLGEVMLLEADRGAIAFIGSSATLHTPMRFSEFMLRALLEEETVGEALMAAKSKLGKARVSYLYNLLGDPALPTR